MKSSESSAQLIYQGRPSYAVSSEFKTLEKASLRTARRTQVGLPQIVSKQQQTKRWKSTSPHYLQKAAFSLAAPVNYSLLPDPIGLVQSAQDGVHIIVNTQTNKMFLNGIIHSYSALINYQNKNGAKLVQLADFLSTKIYTKDNSKLVRAHIIPARMRTLGDIGKYEGICILVPEPYNQVEELPGNSSNRDLRFDPSYLQTSATDLLELKINGSISYVDSHISSQMNCNPQFLSTACSELHSYTIACFRQGVGPAISQVVCASQDMDLHPQESYLGAILVSDGIETIRRLTLLAKESALGKKGYPSGKMVKPAVALYELTEETEEIYRVTQSLISSLSSGPKKIYGSRLERQAATFFDAAEAAARRNNTANKNQEEEFPEFAHPTRPWFTGRFVEAFLEKKKRTLLLEKPLDESDALFRSYTAGLGDFNSQPKHKSQVVTNRPSDEIFVW